MTDTEGVGDSEEMTDTEGVGDSEEMTDTEGVGDGEEITVSCHFVPANGPRALLPCC
jgi:hypothetical protein